MSTKIFPHRAYNPAKNLAPAPVTQEPIQSAADIAAQQRAIEHARLQSKGQRALDRAVARKIDEIKGPTELATKYQQVSGAPDGVHRFFNVDIIMLGTLMVEWKAKRISQTTLMRYIKPIDLWDIDMNACVVCGLRLGTQRWPALLFIARPKPPSKKRPLDPVCVCERCFMDDSKGIAESAMYAYTKLADSSCALEISKKDAEKWALKISLHGIRSTRRVTEYEDEPPYARFNEVITPK